MARQMKDSGIEWIGKIPVNWNSNTAFQIFSPLKAKNIGMQENNLLSLSYGRIIKKDINSSFGLLPESFEGYNIIEPDDIVLRLTDLQNDHTSLRVGFSEQRGIITSAYLTLRTIIDCSPRYLYYQLHSFDICKGLYGMGAGVRRGLNWEGIKALKMVVPDIDEQERIVAFIDHQCAEIDAVITKTKATIEEYKKLKQSIITEAVTKGIRGNREMEDSGIEWIGDIPAHWQICKIKNAFNIFSGATPKSEHKEFWDGDIVWITPADYKTTDKYVSIGKRTLTQEGYGSCGTTLVPENSIIFSKRAPIGSVAISRVPLCTNQGCLSCVSKGNANIIFYYYVMSAFTEIFELFGSGTTFKEISFDSFASFYIPCPNIEEQKEIADYLDKKCAEIDTLIAKKTALLAEMESYKKSVIYECVTGKKEVIQ